MLNYLAKIFIVSLLSITKAEAESKRLDHLKDDLVCNPTCGANQTCCSVPEAHDNVIECVDNQNVSDSCCPPLGNADDC